MGEAARKVRDEAMALPEDEREVLAVELLESLADPGHDWEQAWATEIDRRLADVRSGNVPLRPWAEVRAELRERLARQRGQ
jgi:putative addiction module component (TIGR02574 family)